MSDGSRSGGVEIGGKRIHIGGDVVGRDKLPAEGVILETDDLHVDGDVVGRDKQ